MQYGYIIKITGQNIYNEAQLTSSVSAYSIGTKLESDLRFRKELFFEEFELEFKLQNNQWIVICSDNIFLDFGDVRKFATKPLKHGDVFSVRYQEYSNEIFKIEFLFDFDNENKDYTRVIDIRGRDKILIGNDIGAGIYLSGDYLNGGCFELIKKSGNQYEIDVKNAGYGVYHNGKLVNKTVTVKDGDFFSISYFSFYLKNECIYTSGTVSVVGLPFSDMDTGRNYPKFNRNTRLKSIIDENVIEVLDPPKQPKKPSGNIVMQLLPALAMIALTIVVRGFMGNNANSSFIIFSVCTMSVGIVTSVISMVTDRKKYKKEIKNRTEKYNEYINQKRGAISQYRADELNRLNAIYISPDKELDNISNFSGDIFDKTIDDDDFLELRIGLGTVEALRKVSIRKQEQFESEDELMTLPEQLSNEFRCIKNAPVTLDLKKDNVVGVVGQAESNYQFVKRIVLDIVSRHYYKDVQLFFLIDEKNAKRYSEWVKWLPHIVDEKTKTRNIVYNAESKSSIFERLYVEFGKRLAEKKSSMPYYVIFVLNDWGIKTHPVAQFIPFAHECNTSMFFFESKKKDLPLWCNKIINLTAENKGTIISSCDKDNIAGFEYSMISDEKLISVSKKLSPVYCEEISLENALTRNITLFEMLNILNVDDINLKNNWAKSQIYKSMSAPLGVKTKNEIVCLDLHEKAHGPHGLVAGTTGSGKSEILQTYILSMATHYHPYEVGFVVIDFKGGGMVNQFKHLPHLIGAITNIDGKEINRSLMSIKAELEKRQRAFAENNVNNINNYIKLYKEGKTDIPIPHLIVVVDEFAELKAEQPEFMKELISTARIGRSLGVHLILATQKPAGQVNEQIWSNSKFKLCLKVQTKEDSNEVLKSPLAAEIKEPGRAYLQVGNNEIFELFQSAYSGAPAYGVDASSEKEFTISEVDLQGKRHIVFQQKASKGKGVVKTQLDAIVEYVNNYCKNEGIKHLPNICLEPLKDVIEYKNCDRKNDLLSAPIGIYDDPAHQAQNLAMLNISSGNTVIIGSSQYGKTNLIQVLIRSLAENYSPNEVNIYVLDFGSMALKAFETLHHIGGVVISSEDERVKNLFRLMLKEIASRKEKFAELGITSFNSYIEAGYTDIPHIVIILENFLAFKELYPDYEDDMLLICRDGIALGISVIVTSLQTNGIGYKYMSNFSNRVCLYCNSNDEYNTLFDRCRIEPKNVPGRGLVQIDKEVFELQTFLAFAGEREIDRVGKIQEFVEKSNNRYGEMYAKMIPAIPKILDISYVAEKHLVLKPYQAVVGLDYDAIEFQNIDLAHTVTLGISGREKSSKTNLVKLIFDYCLGSIFDYPTKVYVIDDYSRSLQEFSSYGFIEKYTVDVNILDVLLPEFEEELKRRKNKLLDEGPDFLIYEPLIVCVIENQSVFESGVLSKQTTDIYKRIVSNYKQLKVLFIFTDIPNVSIAYGAAEMLKQVKEINTMFIMDDLVNVKLLDFNNSTLRQYKKPIELGDSYRVVSDGTVTKIRIIKTDERSNVQ